MALAWSLACSAFTSPTGLQLSEAGSYSSSRKLPTLSVKCEKDKKKDDPFQYVSVERPPYYSYEDSTSGQLEPASGARASIPGPEYWPEGTADRVRAARASKPKGKSTGAPSYGKSPGSRRRSYKTSAATSDSPGPSTTVDEPLVPEAPNDILEEPKNDSSKYVVYQSEPEKEDLSEYDMDKKLGRPHPFIDPKV